MHIYIAVMLSLWTFAEAAATFKEIRHGKGNAGWAVHMVFLLASVVALFGHLGLLV